MLKTGEEQKRRRGKNLARTSLSTNRMVDLTAEPKEGERDTRDSKDSL